MPITNKDRRLLRQVFKKIHAEIQGDWLEKVPEEKRPEAINIVAVENFHRVCLEELLNQCMPFDDQFVAEIITRQTAISMTSLPFTTRDEWIPKILEMIPISVNRKVGNAHVVRSNWKMNDEQTTDN